MKLEDIGFYTLTDKRARECSAGSLLERCELIITQECTFKCPYCRGLRADCAQTIELSKAEQIIDWWANERLRNIRFSGGEPTCHPDLPKMVSYAVNCGIKRIAVSTNGYSDLELYKELIGRGVNDFSISLDACCSSFGQKMTGGIAGAWEKVVENISEISKLTYTTVGMVFTEETKGTVYDSVMFAHNLGVADIRVIPSAQDDETLEQLSSIPDDILEQHPILKYRVHNARIKRHMRGLSDSDPMHCYLMIDDMAVCGDYHFPCIIYMREQGDPVGKVSSDMRKERMEWIQTHDVRKDPICRKNCLDVCVDYLRKVRDTNDHKDAWA